MQKGESLRGADKIKFRPIVPLLVDLGAAAASAEEQKWRRSCKRAFFAVSFNAHCNTALICIKMLPSNSTCKPRLSLIVLLSFFQSLLTHDIYQPDLT